MAIPISHIKEGCCDNDLSSFTIIDGDSLDNAGSTCDKIIECSNKYILVEEKSLLFSFFDICCIEVGQKIDDYKYDQDGITYLRITDVISLISGMNIEIKKRLFHQAVNDLLFSSSKKASNTTSILALRPEYDSSKISNMLTFYLYCHSGTPIDTLMNTMVSLMNKKSPFIECITLKNRLLQICPPAP